MSIVACRNIMKNEEVLVSYNYELSGSPEWYKDLWQNHKRYMTKKTQCIFQILQ